MFGMSGYVAAHRLQARHRSRWWLPFVLAALVTMTAGGADAYWKGSGDASGTGATGTSIPLVLSPGTPSATLRPAGQADVALTISNPNSASVHLMSLTLDLSQGASGLTVDTAHSSCDTTSLTFTTQTTGWTVPGRSGAVDGSLPVVLANSISMGVGASDACQGAQFDVHLKAGS